MRPRAKAVRSVTAVAVTARTKSHGPAARSAHTPADVEPSATVPAGGAADRRRPSSEGRALTVSVERAQEITQGDGDLRPPVLSALANEMGRLFKEQFGGGPTAARASWSGDVITVVLENTLTPAERNLATMGEHERLRETRMFFQYATVAEFCEPIERLTGRKVKAFISGIDSEADGLALEMFVLHPAGSDAPSR